jgi:C1A family cysteine protease
LQAPFTKMKFAVCLLLATLALASAAPLAEEQYQTLFTKFVSQHNKQYADATEFFERFNTFKANMNTIIAHQSTKASFSMAMNHFGDLTNAEFKSLYLNYNSALRTVKRNSTTPRQTFNMVDLPSSVDWPSKGVVTPVKNQGQCGSCWAFSTTGSLEAAHAIKTGKLVSLSEQELVDCAGSAGNQGCNGGLMDNAFTWIKSNGGLCTESAYPYTAADGNCQKSSCTSAVSCSGHTDVQANDEAALAAAVTQQPVSVAVDAGGSAWQFYSGGVVSSACGTQLDHGVLAAGYGTLGGADYWLVKNSWGASWGESGYIYLNKTSSSSAPGECGIAMEPSWPTAA